MVVAARRLYHTATATAIIDIYDAPTYVERERDRQSAGTAKLPSLPWSLELGCTFHTPHMYSTYTHTHIHTRQPPTAADMLHHAGSKSKSRGILWLATTIALLIYAVVELRISEVRARNARRAHMVYSYIVHPVRRCVVAERWLWWCKEQICVCVCVATPSPCRVTNLFITNSWLWRWY